MKVSGYAIVFNQPSVVMNESGLRFREIVRPAAVRGSVLDGDIQLLYAHSDLHLLGRTLSRTMSLEVDSHGVRFSATLPDTAIGREVAELIRRRDVAGCSFSFNVAVRGDEWLSGTPPTRIINQFARIYELTITASPAYPSTSVSLRTSAAQPKTQPWSKRVRKELQWVEKMPQHDVDRWARAQIAIADAAMDLR